MIIMKNLTDFFKTVGTGVDPHLEYYSDPPSQPTSIEVGADPVRFYFLPPIFSWLRAYPSPEWFSIP